MFSRALSCDDSWYIVLLRNIDLIDFVGSLQYIHTSGKCHAAQVARALGAELNTSQVVHFHT